MSDAVTSPDANKKPDQSTEDVSAATGTEPKASETTNTNADASDAQAKKKDQPGQADKQKSKQSSKGGKIGDQDPTAENEIRVAAKGAIKNYLGYAFRILNKTDHRSLTIRATGNAIVKALILIELVKRRVGELHQLNKIYSMEIVSHEESKIEGMDSIESRRRVTAMDTTLSKDPLDESDPGYQQPQAKEEQPATPPQKSEPAQRKQNKGEQNKGENKKGHNKGPKQYNYLETKGDQEPKEPKKDGDQKHEKQRRDTNKANKHEHDKEDGKGPKDKKDHKKGQGKKDQEKGAPQNKDEKPKSRKEKLKANTIKDDEDRHKRRDMKPGPQQQADYKIRRRLGGGGANPNKRYNDSHPDNREREEFRGGPPGHGGPKQMPMDRDFHHDRERGVYVPPYPMRSYDDFHVRNKQQRKKRDPFDGLYNEERNRGPYYMNQHGPGYYPMPPYHDPYYYPMGPGGYGRDGPRIDRPDERKMNMYPEPRRQGEPFSKNGPPGRDPRQDPRGYQGNFDPERPPIMRDGPPMGGPPGQMNRRDGPGGPMREGRPPNQGPPGPSHPQRGPPPGEMDMPNFERAPIRGGRGMRGGRGRGGMMRGGPPGGEIRGRGRGHQVPGGPLKKGPMAMANE